MGSLSDLAELPTTIFPVLGNLAKEVLCFFNISHKAVSDSVSLLLFALSCATSSTDFLAADCEDSEVLVLAVF